MEGETRMNVNINGIFSGIKNPLDSKNNIRRFINAFATSNGDVSDFIKVLNQPDANPGNFISTEDYDSFYSNIFNRWKHAVVNCQPWWISFLDKVDNHGFSDLQRYLERIPDVKTKEEIDDLFTNSPENIQKVLENFNLNAVFSGTGWNIISSYFLDNSDIVGGQHTLHMNINARGIHKFSELFIQKCEEFKLPYCFYISNHQTHSDDSFILFSDYLYLKNYYEIIHTILKENKELEKYISKPPILTAQVDNYIGYCTADTYDYSPLAYQDILADIIYKAIDYHYQQGLFNHPNVLVRENDIPNWKSAALYAVDSKLEFLNSLPEKQLKLRFGIKKSQLKSKKFQNHLVKVVSDSFYEGFQKKSTDFRPIRFPKKKNRFGKFFQKNKITLSLEFSKQELQDAAKYFNSNKRDFTYLKVADANSRKITVQEQATQRIVDKKMDFLKSLSKKDLKTRYGLKPHQLRKRKFLKSLCEAVAESIGEGLKKKSMDFTPVKFYYGRNKKNKTKYLEITENEIQKAVRSTLPSIAETYPKFLEDVRNTIIANSKNRGLNPNNICLAPENDRESYLGNKATYVDGIGELEFIDENGVGIFENNNTKPSDTTISVQDSYSHSGIPLLEDHLYQPQQLITQKDLSTDDFDLVPGHYHFTKEQIIQDLSPNSKEPSRYTGLMSEMEIKLSQEKIKILQK